MHVRQGRDTIRGNSAYRNGTGWFALQSFTMPSHGPMGRAGQKQGRLSGTAFATLALDVSSHRFAALSVGGHALDIVIDLTEGADTPAYLHVTLGEAIITSFNVEGENMVTLVIAANTIHTRQGPSPQR
jgi:hypothetical protein